MTNNEFNEKYKDYLEDGSYFGMDIGIPKLIDWFDKLFSTLIKEYDDFEYFQIKLKFGYVRFYSSLSINAGQIIESTANKVLNERNKNK